VRFAVDPGSGLLQPTVVHRHRLAGRRAVVRLRLAGRFVSAFEARGTVRGRIVLRGRRACSIPPLAWVAEADGAPAIDEPLVDEVEEELDVDECEGCEEPLEDDEEPPEDEEP
jgi:hypothetical protein